MKSYDSEDFINEINYFLYSLVFRKPRMKYSPSSSFEQNFRLSWIFSYWLRISWNVSSCSLTVGYKYYK